MADLNVSPTLRINEQVKSMWEDGKDVLHLGIGESRFPPSRNEKCTDERDVKP